MHSVNPANSLPHLGLGVSGQNSGSQNGRGNFAHFQNSGKHGERLAKEENVWENLGNV